MVRQLPIVQIDDKKYFFDERLREYRQVDDPYNRISFDELGDREPVLISDYEEISLQKKRNHKKGKRL